MTLGSLLVVEDEADLRMGMAAYFNDLGYQTIEAENGLQGVEIFKAQHPDVVFTDLRMPLLDGFGVIEAIMEIAPDTPVVVVSGTGVMEDAVRAMRMGARDYLVKPIHEMSELELVLKRVLNESSLQREVAALKEHVLRPHSAAPSPVFNGMVTSDPGMQAVFNYLETIAVTSHPVLILGETGTGKELLSRAVHDASGRTGTFVPVNVAGLEDQLFSDTLFGHVKGAFTGADKNRDGVVAQAKDGTLFLDEIGDLSPVSQVKLLRLLQEGVYYPIGSDYQCRSNARIVAATHASLEKLVREGHFRQDLYYRLKTHQVQLPPLRDRTGDLPLLIDTFIEQAASELGKKPPGYPPELLCYLAAYSFPGNIRELQALVFDAVARQSAGMLSMQSFINRLLKLK